MPRNTAQPKTRRYAEREIKRAQSRFTGGVTNDLAVSEGPRGADYNHTSVHRSQNWILHPEHAEVRGGYVRLWDTQLPTVGSGIAATKSGSTITISSGYSPTSADVGRYFVWDDTDGDNELITAVAGNDLTVARSTSHSAATAAAIRCEVNADPLWHTVSQKWILFCGQKLYYTDEDGASWTEIYCVGQYEHDGAEQILPDDAKSTLWQRDNVALLWNTNGLYRIEIGATVPVCYKINWTMLESPIGNAADIEDHPYKRRVTMTMARMSESTLLDRINGNTIVQESAPFACDSEGRDYFEYNSEHPIGKKGATYGRLTGGTLNAARDTPAEWETLAATGQAKFTANNQTYNINPDFSGCLTFADVADRIEVCLRDFWPNCTFRFYQDDSGNEMFRFTMPNKGDSVGYCTAGAAGTDISDSTYLNMQTGQGTIANVNYNEEHVPLWCDSFEEVVSSTTRVAGLGAASPNGVVVVWNDTLWAVEGQQALSSSDNGVTWTAYTQDANLPTDGFSLCVFDDKLWVLGGQSSDVYYTSDGETWTLATATPGWGARYGEAAVVHDSKLWVIGGSEGTLKADVWYSADGTSWTQATADGGFAERFYHRALSYDDKLWVMGGRLDIGEANDVYSSSDGVTWTEVTSGAEWSARNLFSAIVVDNQMFVIGGRDSGEADQGEIWRSTDGATWTLARDRTEWKDRTAFGCVELNGYVYIIQGFSGTEGELLDIWRGKIPGLQPPYTKLSTTYYYPSPFTHYCLWGTMDVGVNGINPNTGKGNSAGLYGWMMDVPIVKAFVVTSDASGNLTASKGTFHRYDVGSILTLSDGTEGVITDYYSDTEAAWNWTEVKTSLAGTIGTTLSFKASQSSYTVTISAPAAGRFASTDVGQMIFWDDGTMSTITGYTSATVVTVGDSTTRSAMGGGVVDLSSTDGTINRRVFNDYITDDVLDARINAGYFLKTRFFEPLPNSAAGCPIPGFLVSAPRGGRYLYYSQVTDEPWRVGYYHPKHQVFTVDDAVKDVRPYGEVFSALCPRSVTTWDALLTEDVGDAGLGQSVIVITRKRTYHGIGLVDYTSIARVSGQDVDVLCTTDMEVRMFDGRTFSANSARDHYMDQLRQLQPLGSASYDAISGYHRWGTTGALTTVGANSRLPYPDKCYLFAIDEGQGVAGGIEITGDDWLMPPDGVRPSQMTDSNGYARQIALDNLSGRFYWMSTYDGPTGSGLSRILTDKAADTSTDGTEISSALWYKAHTGSDKAKFITHRSSTFFIEPEDEDDRDASGYDSNGFRDGLEIDVEAYKDGAPTDYFGKRYNTPDNGEVLFQEHDEAHEIQMKLSANRSGLRLDGSVHYYAQKDKPPAPAKRDGDEAAWQSTLAGAGAWFTRGPTLALDRCSGTGQQMTGTITAATGPDGYSESAMSFSSAIVTPTIAMAGGYVAWWQKGTIAFKNGTTEDTPVSTYVTYGSWSLKYTSRGITGSQTLTFTPTGTAYLFDVRAFLSDPGDPDPDTDMLEYWYNNIKYNSGDDVCPRWGG